MLETTDEGLPFIYRVPVGRGSVVFVNAACYAADPAVKQAWLRTLDRLNTAVLTEEPFTVETDETIEHTVFRQEDGSYHLYLLAIDWWRPEDAPRMARLHLGKSVISIDVRWGTMLKIAVEGSRAVWCETEDGEVLSFDQGMVSLQGVDRTVFHFVKDGREEVALLDFSEKAVQEIPL